MEKNDQSFNDNLEVNSLAPVDGFLSSTEESPEEQARLDELTNHDPKADVVDLGKIEDLEKINPIIASDEKNSENNNNLTLSKNKVLMMKKIAQSLRDSAGQLVELLSMVAEDEVKIKTSQIGEVKNTTKDDEVDGSVVEGIFDGEKMIGPDGKTYVVPVNYASKSRLVEGDTLKLIITGTGTFIYKQINPIERRRLVGALDEGENGEYYVIVEDRRWRVLPASITYYKGEVGDEVVILVPKTGSSRWGAVENVVKR